MKRVLNGSVYNTDSAKELGCDSYSNPSDFSHWVETLYRTKAGKYFLHGEGGPTSRYAVAESGNCWSGGEKILPITEDEARAWSEEHLSGDEFERIFGEISEDIETTQINALISVELKAKLDAEKVKTGETTAELISRLIDSL